MNGFEAMILELKDVKKELGELNKKLDNLDKFDKHMVESTAVIKDNTKAMTEQTAAIRDISRVIKEKRG